MQSDVEAFIQCAGFVTRPQILSLGLDDRYILNARRAGDLVRLGPGLYTGAWHSDLSPEDQHIVTCKAVATRFTDSVAFSHQSAAVLHGVATFGLSLDQPHLTRTDTGRGRVEAGVVHHVGDLDDAHVTTVDGLPVVTPSRMVWDIATTSSIESGIVTADSALHLGVVTEPELEEIAGRHTRWRGARRAKVSLSRADGRAESPGESRTRIAIADAGLPRPVPQHPIYDNQGILVAIVDFAWPQYRHIVEFDGLLKYSHSSDLAKEKAREDAIRAAGWGVTRIIWSQLSPGVRRALTEELQRSLNESRRQFGHLVG